MKTTQEKWVIDQLIKKGKVSRNQALAKYISRLGAYICDLRNAGWNISGSYVKKGNSKDFVYTLVK